MPDADVAVRANFLVELHPVWIVGQVAVARIRGQVLERPPVLHIRGQAQRLPSEKPALRIRRHLCEHLWHCGEKPQVLGSFHQRLKRAPIMKTTKSPSIEAAMRRLIVVIGPVYCSARPFPWLHPSRLGAGMVPRRWGCDWRRGWIRPPSRFHPRALRYGGQVALRRISSCRRAIHHSSP